MGIKIIMFQLVFTFFTLSQAAYYSRMATVNRLRSPTAFRPGVSLQQRPWNHRLVQAASHRAPYVIYRSPPHRYAVKHYAPSTRNVFAGGPWKTTSRMPGIPGLSPVTPEYEFIKAASAPPIEHNDGAIHTIPAPNLSLSEKPIVVIDTLDSGNHASNAVTEQVKNQGHYYQMRLIDKPKLTYEVTEKYIEPVFQMAKVETPVGFSKMQSNSIQTSPDVQTYLRNGAALQIASDYGLSAISVPHNHIIQQAPQVPQQYSLQGFQGFNGLRNQQELLHSGADSVMIPPNVLYQSDPLFLQKLQHQLLQRYPSVEFVPYGAELLPQQPQPNNHQTQAQQLFLLENEELKQHPEPFISSESKNVVQRETQEGSLVTLIPQAFVVSNVTEKTEETTTSQPHNITLELVATESQPVSTTIKYVIESNTEPQNTQNTTPIYYAQVGQSVGNVIANGFYTAINDVRAAAVMEQMENTQSMTKVTDNPTTTTTTNPSLSQDLQQYFVKNSEKADNNTVTELKPLHGVPFAKPADSVKVAYTLLRAEEKEPKMTQEGNVYAGQIVEASISEDHDFNNQKTLMKRAPIRLFAVTDKVTTSPTPSSAPKVTMVKAKIPPKSKLTFDDKTGEPVLRIYASYVDSPNQRQIVTSKLTSLKPVAVTRKTMDTIDNWKSSTVKTIDKTQGFDGNQVTKFGLKLRSRSDDYIPLFEEYDE